MSPARILAATTGLVAAILLLAAGPAAAHSTLVSVDPADGSSLDAGPPAVTLTFDEPVQAGLAQVRVVGPDGNLWTAGEATVRGSRVTAPLTPLGPVGDYTVAYRVVSADGHPVSGTRGFTLTTPGAGTPGPPADAASAADGSGGSSLTGWAVAAVVVVVAVLTAGNVAVRRRWRARWGRRGGGRAPGGADDGNRTRVISLED